MITIGVYQSLSNSAMYKHICSENINKSYKYASKFDYQHQFTVIMEADMLSTHMGLMDNITVSVGTLGTQKKPSSRKLFSQFLALLDLKQNPAVYRMGSSKTKCKAIRTCSDLWSSIHKWRGDT